MRLKKMDDRITEWCSFNKIILRSAGNGLWLCSILPAALLVNVAHFASFSELYKIISILSIGQFISAICNMLHNNDIPYIPIGYLFSSTTASLLLVFFTDRGLVYSLFATIATSVCYPFVIKQLLKSCPKCFTYGEAVLISQSLILFLTSFFTNIIISLELYVERCENTASFILQAGFFGVLVILAVAYKFPEYIRKVPFFLLTLISSFFTFAYFIPQAIIEINSLLWVLELMNNRQSIILILVWILCCSCAIYCLYKQIRESRLATTASRKSFHFLVVIIFVSGLIYNSCLVYVASGVVFALMIVGEIIRKLKVFEFSESLQLCFDAFKDQKDEGGIALTPMYLMVGCAAPLWIYPFSFLKYIPMPVLSGVLTVGIGDAMASIFGNLFGERKWSNSSKTIEGSCCCFFSQIVTLLLLNSCGIIQEINIIWSLMVLAITTLIEAKTDQIDNIVLPFVSYILFNINL